jgi:hypothetical protein
MKKMILGFLTASTLIAGQAPAAPANATTPANTAGMENDIQARLLEQVLNSIEKASVDLNIGDITVVSEGSGAPEVQTNDVSLSGMIGFGSDWKVDLVLSDQPQTANDPVQKIYPKLSAGAASLNLAVDLKMNAKQAVINAKFYSGFDNKTKKWLPRPLVLKVTNQLNKNLLTIRVHSLTAQKKVNAQNPKVQDIAGTCESDKMLFDFVAGGNKQVPVDCRFSGTLSENGGYKISFKYATK